MVQTVYWYYFTAHSASWTLDAEVYPFQCEAWSMFGTIQPLAPVTWASVPLALRLTFPDGTSEDLRLTVGRRRIPHGAQAYTPMGMPVYPIVTGSQGYQCYWRYTSARTCWDS